MARAHLVGSFPRENAEEVYRTAAGELGGSIARLADGETDDRKGWFTQQLRLLKHVDGIEDAPPKQEGARPFPQIRLGKPANEIKFPPLVYASHAKASYETFKKLRDEGVIPEGVRFQVGFPTPLAVVGAFVIAEDQPAFYDAYEPAVLNELKEICEMVPASELAIQWDVAIETSMLEGKSPHWFDGDGFDAIIALLARLGDAVPADAEVGFHLCYGYYERKHFMDPDDLGLLTKIANAVGKKMSRPINFIHMPVPINHGVPAFFEPLKDLELADTELYLGLVHDDGLEASAARADVAREVLGDREFGVGTECGMGQYPAEAAIGLLQTHAQL
jgi:hypothetical protein